MSKLNWKIMAHNLAETREQIEQIEKGATTGDRPSEFELPAMFEHAYHHLNFAWNIRHISTENYSNLSDAEYNQWGRFPVELQEFVNQSPIKHAE
jgi:hypothetical protein